MSVFLNLSTLYLSTEMEFNWKCYGVCVCVHIYILNSECMTTAILLDTYVVLGL